MDGLKCWNCGAEGKHDIEYEKDGLYVCASCGKINGYLCRGCDKVYLENRLIKHGDAYVCKICDRPQWGYTEYKRKEAGERA